MKFFSLTLTALCVMASVSSCNKKQVESSNPLLAKWDTMYEVPPFDKIKTSDYMPAFKEAMAAHEAEIDAITKSKDAPTFANTIFAFDNSGALLSRVSNVFFSLTVADTAPELQQVQEEVAPMLSAHNDAIMLNDKLFERIKTVYDNRDASKLDKQQKRLVEKIYKSFVRSGANLDGDAKKEFAEINGELAKLSFNFSKNLLAENARFSMLLNEEETQDLPSAVRNSARDAAKAAGHGENSYLFDISKPSMLPFLTYSGNRELREKIYKAYIEKCSHGDELDNNDIINRIIELRTRKAKLLGFNTYAEYIIDNNMAKNPVNVYGLLDEVWIPALERAKGELADMRQLKLSESGNDSFSSWDWWYYAEKIRKQKYDMSQDELRPYFSLENVKQGIFELSNRLYGITFKPVVLPVYNEEVSSYEVFGEDGKLLGILYLDMHPRAGRKGQGAWCGTFREQTYKNGERVVPLVYIVANFTRPTRGVPALLDLDETKTFFHEFGHALHSLFSDVKYKGLLSVENDFVELPSQIMENWATEPEVLKSYAIHWSNGKVIPEHLIDRIRKSAYFNQGFETVEMVSASYADMDIHNMPEYSKLDVNKYTRQILNEQRGLISQIEPRYNYPYFLHIFDSGFSYSAGYYGYLWAEVLDKDAYQAFVETDDIFDKKTAERFRREILSKGGTEDGMVLYQNFRGRQPSRLPLLRARGLAPEAPVIDDAANGSVPNNR